MCEKISIAQVKQKIQQQKEIALQTPVYVFGSQVAIDGISNLMNSYKGIFQNPNLFEVHEPDECENVLTAAVQRTLVFFFYKAAKVYQKKWLDMNLLPELQQIPTCDVFAIDITKNSFEEDKILAKLGVETVPTVLVYRIGHQIDKILPEVEVCPVSDQITAFNLQKRFDAERGKHQYVLDPTKEGKIGDEDRIAFENRLREKEAEEKRKEAEAQRKYRLQVLRKIEEDKKARKGINK